MDRMDDHEMISALADGQLRGAAFARGVQLAAGDEGRRTWDTYHLIGEVLRTGRAPVASAPDAFLARLQERLRQERPLPVRPRQEPVGLGEAVLVSAAAGGRQAAANDWRWKLLAGVASVAAVAAVGWNLLGATLPGAGSAQPQLAAAPASAPAAPVAPRAAAMIRDPRLDQLLAAHRHLGGASALQSSGFLRSATFEGPAR